MHKYAFSIRTRSGQAIDRIVIAGRERDDAERKLKQMYHYCEVVSCEQLHQNVSGKRHVLSAELLSAFSR